eukprot:m.286983 g.286983  ORF g.286983 m.286983 type:complete len:97 (-) comp55005_c0_seq1:269-559(-)
MLRRHGLLSGFGLLDSRVHEAKRQAGSTPEAGVLIGDGLQMGATFVIDKGGRVLMDFRQEYYGHEASLNDIRAALGLPPQPDASTSSARAASTTSS